MYFDDQTSLAIKEARKVLANMELIEYFRKIRRTIPNPYEPWIRVTEFDNSRADRLYEIMHLGRSIPIEGSSFSNKELKILQRAGLIDIKFGCIFRKYKLSCFGNWFCVSDSPADGNSLVYIGDDSLIFSEFVSGTKGCRTGLDMGFGSGISSIALAESCEEVTAFDIVPACLQAGRMTALLNGCDERIRFLTSDVAHFSPPRGYDVIIGNPPGVPVPSGFQYSPAGLGGADGLEYVRLFIRKAFQWANPNGEVKMRFQSIGDIEGPFILRYVRGLAQRLGFDVKIKIDSIIPIEVRTALSVMNVLKLAPNYSMEDLFRNFDNHMSTLGATTYSTMLMTARRRDRCQFRLTYPTINFSFMDSATHSFNPAGREEPVRLFDEITGKLPNIFYLLGTNKEIKIVRDAIVQIRDALHDRTAEIRTIFKHSFNPSCFANEAERRALMLPFIAAVRALTGYSDMYQ